MKTLKEQLDVFWGCCPPEIKADDTARDWAAMFFLSGIASQAAEMVGFFSEMKIESGVLLFADEAKQAVAEARVYAEKVRGHVDRQKAKEDVQ